MMKRILDKKKPLSYNWMRNGEVAASLKKPETLSRISEERKKPETLSRMSEERKKYFFG